MMDSMRPCAGAAQMARAARAALPAVIAMAVGLGGALAAACGHDGEDQKPAASAPAGDAITRTTEHGPVRATVTLAPEAPRLGDPLTLTLEVEAEPGVQIEMPSFGEALGRFQIVQFVPRQSVAHGKTVLTQTYTLQAPMSGRQRIPPLRIELVDQRAGQAHGQAHGQAAGQAAGGGDAGPAGAASAPAGAASAGTTPDTEEVQELLTDEIALQVASVLPEGAVAGELHPALEALPLRGRGPVYLLLGLAALALATAGGWLAFRAWRRRARQQARISAYDAAMARLHALEQHGLPGPDDADAWYVDLSAIVRRYLEDRYGLRAPELTTEEFLLEAQRSGQLTGAHRELLSRFLARCDRVKFARYAPEDAESQDALDSARAFLEETRVQVAATPAATQAEPGPAPGQVADQPAGQATNQPTNQPTNQADTPGEAKP